MDDRRGPDGGDAPSVPPHRSRLRGPHGWQDSHSTQGIRPRRHRPGGGGHRPHRREDGGAGDGPIPLPTKTQRWTVLRSPHVDKKSREQFELKTHKRMIDILDSRAQTMDALTKLDLPAGVDVEIKVE